MDGLSGWRVLSQETSAGPLNPGWEAYSGLVNDLYPRILHLQGNQATAALRDRFQHDVVQRPIIHWLSTLSIREGMSPADAQALHKGSLEYAIDGGCLWRMRKGMTHCVECLTREEGCWKMLKVHAAIDHWDHDILLSTLLRNFDWPQL